MVKNPFFSQAKEEGQAYVSSDVATKEGIASKTIFSIILAIVAGLIVSIFLQRTITSNVYTEEQKVEYLSRLVTYAVIVGIVDIFVVLIGRFVPKTAKYCTPIYAVGEGSIIGILCSIGEMYLPGVTVMAGAGTAVVFLVTFAFYNMGLNKRIGKIYSIAIAYMITLLLVSLFLFIFQLTTGFALSWGLLLAIEFLYLGYAVIMLTLDFAEADMVVSQGVAKTYEWTVVLGFIITIFYIFVELFRIIMIIASKDN